MTHLARAHSSGVVYTQGTSRLDEGSRCLVAAQWFRAFRVGASAVLGEKSWLPRKLGPLFLLLSARLPSGDPRVLICAPTIYGSFTMRENNLLNLYCY